MAEGKKLSETLLNVMKQYKLLSLPKLQKAVTLNYYIVANSVIHIDIKNKILTVEYQIPCEVERNVVGLMRDSGVEFTKDIMPNEIIRDFLKRLLIPIYYNIAKEYRWSRSWVDWHNKSIRGDYWKKDTIIRLTARPMNNNEIRQDIFKSVRDAYIAIRVAVKAPKIDENEMKNPVASYRELQVKKMLKKWSGKEAGVYTKSFIKQLKDKEVIDENLKLLCSDARYKKAINEIARGCAGYMDKKTDEKTGMCLYPPCKKLYLVTSKHKRKFCSDLCRALAFRNKNKPVYASRNKGK